MNRPILIISNEPTKILSNDTKIWENSEGQWHRDGDKPAVITPGGRCEWWIDGKRHRDDDLPAIIWPEGAYAWYQNNRRHRDHDLPAMISIDDYCSWWQNGRLIKDKYCTKKEIEEFKKPYHLQRKNIQFDRFESLIK